MAVAQNRNVIGQGRGDDFVPRPEYSVPVPGTPPNETALARQVSGSGDATMTEPEPDAESDATSVVESPVRDSSYLPVPAGGPIDAQY